MPGELRLHARPHPLHDRRVDLEIPAGLTLEQIFSIVQPNAIFRRGAAIYVDDWYIPEDKWHVVRPRPGRFIQIAAAIPQDMGGGGGKKSPLRMVLMLAVVAASFAVPALFPATSATVLFGSLTVGHIIGAAVGLIGMALVNALVPPQTPKLSEMSGRSLGGGSSPSLTITGIRNAENRYGPVPRGLGTWRWFPPKAAASYREVIGNETYFRALFELGPGPMRLSQHRIGDRPISELKDIQIETRGTPGQAAAFDGVDDYVEIGAIGALNITGALTLEGWVYVDGVATTSAARAIMSWASTGFTSYPFHWIVREVGGKWKMRLNGYYNGVATPVDDTAEVTPDAWHHVAVTVSATGAYQFYIDKEATGSGNTAAATRGSGDGKFMLGRDSQFFKGKLDDLRVWNVARTAEQIFESAEWKPCTNTTGLVGRWEFDDGDARDYTPNGFKGTIKGGGLKYEEGQTFKDYPVTLFANSASQKGYSVRLKKSDGERILETGPDADEIILDLSANGLVAYNELAQPTERAVDVQIDYQLQGAATWTPWGVGEVEGTDLSAVPGYQETVQQPVYAGGNRDSDPVIVGYQTMVTNTVPARIRSVDATFSDKNIRSGDTVTISGFTNPANNGDRTVQYASQHELGVSGTFVEEAAGAEVNVIAHGRSTTIKAATPEPYTESVRIVPPARGKYRLRIKRLTDDSTADTIRDELYITAINTLTYSPPATLPGMCQVAIRVKATGEFNSELDQYNVLSQAMLPSHDGEKWLKPEVTSNPAWCALTIVRDAAMMDPVPDENIDFASWVAFAQRNAVVDQNNEARFQFDGIVDTRRTVKELLTDILATARATLAFPDLKLGVTWDERQPTAVRMVSPRNSWGFKTQTVFTDLPHGIIVQFVNKERDYREDQVVAYADGYDESNATRFETMQQWGVVRRSQNWREGRYRYANGKLRPRIYELSMGADGMLLDRNSLAEVGHDVPRFGKAWGQIVSVTKNGSGQVVGLTVDELVTTEAGKSYGLSIRRPGGVNIFVNLLTPNGTVEGQSLIPAAPIPAGDSPEVGDHFLFGELGRVSQRLIVQSIRRGPNRTATLRWVDEAPAVHDADLGAIPAYQPGQNFGPAVRAGVPPKPIVVNVNSDETAIVKLQDGTQQLRIVMTIRYDSGQVTAPSGLDVLYRPTGSNAQWATKSFPAETRIVALDQVEQDVEYEVEMWTRSSTRLGVTSEMTRVVHTVVGRRNPPPNVEGVVLDNRGLFWLYPNQPNDFWGFRVRFKLGVDRDPAGALSAHPSQAVIASPPFGVDAFPGGVVTVFVYAVDTSGNESLNPATIIYGGTPDRANILVTRDFRELGWPGDTTGEENAGDLVASADDAAFIPSDDSAPFIPAGSVADFIPDDATGTYQSFSYTALLEVSAEWLPAQLSIDYEVEGPMAIEYQTDSAGIFIPEGDDEIFIPEDDLADFIPAPGDFMPWPIGLPMQLQPYQFRFSAPGGSVRSRLKQFKAVIDVADVREPLYNVVLAPGGSRLPITKSFREILNVENVSILGGTAVVVKALDYDADLGPLMAGYDAGGTSVSTTINGTPAGF